MSGFFDPNSAQKQPLHNGHSIRGPMSTPTTAVKKVNPKPRLPSFADSNDTPGESSAAKVRAYAACKNCRAKKIKCLPGPPQSSSSARPGAPSSPAHDSNQPGPCQQCLQAGAECTYAPTRDRAAYSRHYVANLEARVQALESFQTRMLPLLSAFEDEHGSTSLPPSRMQGLIKKGIPGEQGPRAGENHHHVTSMEKDNVPLEWEGEGDDEDDDDDEQTMQNAEAGDVVQMTQDERGNYRWIGSSNTLSLLDSFSHREDPHHGETSRQPHTSFSRSNPPSRVTSSGQSPNTAGGDQTPRNPYFGEVAGAGVVKALPAIEEVQYPSTAKASEMIDAFFREVHSSLPVVLEYEFRDQYEALSEARRRDEPWPSGGFVAVVFAVFALGERVLVTTQAWQRERAKVEKNGEDEGETVLPGEAEAGVVWYERAQILHYSTSRDINIYQVQALTLMAAFQASVNAVPMSWLQAGKALRTAQDLGLHRSTAGLNIPFAEKQLRARCWWAIYGLERLISIALGRPLGVDDLDIDVAYPVEMDDEGLRLLALRDAKATPSAQETTEEPIGSTMSGFVALTKLCKIAGKVAHLLYRPSNGRSVNDPSWAMSQQNAINKLDKHLRDWLEHEVPTKYKDPSATHSVSLFSAILSNSYFAVLITLHRNFLPSSPDYPRPKPPPSSQSLAHCVDAARSVVHIGAQSRTLIPPSHHLAMYCQYLWSSAIILLLCEVQARDRVVIEAVGAQVESCRRCLQALEPVWPGSRKLKELLNDVAARAKDVQVVDLAVAARPEKKRKTSTTRSNVHGTVPLPSPKRQPSVVRPNSSDGRAWQMSPSPSVTHSDMHKRPRLYETSDTRTSTREDDVRRSVAFTNEVHPPTSIPNPGYYSPAMPLFPSMSLQSGTQTVPSFDIPFDLGGVTFDGLDMLQGFGDSASNFWSSLGFTGEMGSGDTSAAGSGANSANPYANTSMTQAQSLPQVFSGHNTPTSNGAVPSPAWQVPAPVPVQYQQAPTPTQNQQYANAVQGGMNNPLAEFWDQIAGNSFDWQADPNVPFNI